MVRQGRLNDAAPDNLGHYCSNDKGIGCTNGVLCAGVIAAQEKPALMPTEQGAPTLQPQAAFFARPWPPAILSSPLGEVTLCTIARCMGLGSGLR